MVTKMQKTKPQQASTSPLSSSVKDSAQQIWLAGLGAFSKAQEEGGKVFDALVKEGVSIQRKTQSVAEEKLSEASSRMSSMANDIGSKASGQWDKLEGIFEDRVAKALAKLGVPSAKDVAALTARVEALNKSVLKLAGKPAGKAAGKPAAKVAVKPVVKAAPKAPAKAAPKQPAVKAAAKRAPRKAAAPAVNVVGD
jgi:poly(hydroxyalkanoate) granule-associated protein